MRSFLCFICCIFISAAAVKADEQIFVSGGCSLLYFEKHKPSVHDKYWGNFIDVVPLRYNQIKSTLAPDDQLTWLIYRPAYVKRGREERGDLLAAIRSKAAGIPVRIIWFDDKQGLLDYLNKGQDRRKVKVSRFEYFGHSNMLCFMFDYSNGLDGASPEGGILHQNELKKIDYGIFTKNAFAKSWGCHSGESYSIEWKKRFGIPLIGAIGKTDYSNGGIPFISTKDGQWSQ